MIDLVEIPMNFFYMLTLRVDWDSRLEWLRVLEQGVVRPARRKVHADGRRRQVPREEGLHEGDGGGRADGAARVLVVGLVLQHRDDAPARVHGHEQRHGVLQNELLAEPIRRVALHRNTTVRDPARIT